MDFSFKEYMLFESRFDWFTTLLARAIMRVFKKHPEAVEHLKYGEKIKLFHGSTERLAKQNPLAIDGEFEIDLPDDFFIKNVLVYFFPTPLRSTVGGAMVNRESLIMNVYINNMQDSGRPDFVDIYPKMIEILRHEIEHRFQKDKSVIGSFAWGDSLERAEDYFLHPREIEAWVSGLYKKAKSSRRPFREVLEEKLKAWENMMFLKSDANADVVEALLRKIKNTFIGYAKKRFPNAQI